MVKPLLLVVEDEPISLEVLVDILHEYGYATVTATTGAGACSLIEEYGARLDGILLDRLLPDMDSLNLLVKLKSVPALTHLPVIMQTSLSAEQDIADGLKAGAYYYLTKPFLPATLLAIVRSAVKDRYEYPELQQSLLQTRGILKNLRHAEFCFTTQGEARALATLTAHVAPDPERVVLGLTELMLNAVEHGNLGIAYAEKSALIAANALESEVERRLKLPEFSHRLARLKIDRDLEIVRFEIIDEGRGFDWQPFMEMSPSRAFNTHGRGIAMSKLLSFDQMEYRGCGNEVVGLISL